MWREKEILYFIQQQQERRCYVRCESYAAHGAFFRPLSLCYFVQRLRTKPIINLPFTASRAPKVQEKPLQIELLLLYVCGSGGARLHVAIQHRVAFFTHYSRITAMRERDHCTQKSAG